MVLTGEAHALRTTPESAASPHEFLRADASVDIPPTIAIGAGGRVAARVLSGRLHATWPDEASGASMPSLLRIGQDQSSPASVLLRPEALPLAGMGPGSAALLTRLASVLLVAGLRADPRCRKFFSPPRRDPIAEALRIIEANPSASWTVERLARSVGMGRSNFAAHFTQQVGRAPMEVVAEQRMEHAAALLRQGKLKIAEISEMAGYGSEAAFSRRFTRHFGITPSQMRDIARSNRGEAPGAAHRFHPLLASRLVKGAAAVGRQQTAGAESGGAAGSRQLVLPPQSGILFRGARD
jgi:AraC-like DNA-binding protein